MKTTKNNNNVSNTVFVRAMSFNELKRFLKGESINIDDTETSFLKEEDLEIPEWDFIELMGEFHSTDVLCVFEIEIPEDEYGMYYHPTPYSDDVTYVEEFCPHSYSKDKLKLSKIYPTFGCWYNSFDIDWSHGHPVIALGESNRDSEGRISIETAEALISVGLKCQHYFGVQGQFDFKQNYETIIKKVRYSSDKEICYILSKILECRHNRIAFGERKRDSEGRISFEDAEMLVSIGLKCQQYFGIEGEFIFNYHDEYDAWRRDPYDAFVEEIRYSSDSEIGYIIAKMLEFSC